MQDAVTPDPGPSNAAAAIAFASLMSPVRRPRSVSRAPSLTSSTPTNSYATFDTVTPLPQDIEARLSPLSRRELPVRATPPGAELDEEDDDGANSALRSATRSAGNSNSKGKGKRRRRWSRTSPARYERVGTSSRRASGTASGNRSRRSISQALLRRIAGASSSDEGEDWGDGGETTFRSQRRSLRRPSIDFFLTISNNEVISTYPRRVSAVIRPRTASHRSSLHPYSAPEADLSRRSIHGLPPVGGGSAILDDHESLSEEDDDSFLLEQAPLPYGVRKMEVLSRYMPKPYAAIYLITLFTSLSSTTTPAVEPFLLSLFGGHAYISSVAIITSIAYAVCKPITAKVLDTFGRAEGLAVSALLYGIGQLLVGSSQGIVTFACARVIGSAGAQGINLSQQVIVADITSLASRALVTSTIFLPWLISPWIGPRIGAFLLGFGEQGYRAAYTIFGILVPISCLALLVALWKAYRHVRNLTSQARPVLEALKDAADTDGSDTIVADDALDWRPRGMADLATEARNELDLLGIFYLMVGCTLFLLPLSLAANSAKAWRDPLYPSLALLGLLILCLLAYHEMHVASHPLVPTRLLRDRTVMAGCALGACHFFCQFSYESYFPSFLQVARNYSVQDASYISQSYVFSASIAALGCGLLVKVTRRYKAFMVIGVLLHMVGAVMMVRFRSLDTSTFVIVASQVMGGLGGGFTTLGAQLGVQAVVSHQDVAIVTAVFLTITQIGGAVGGAASGAIWSTFLPSRLSQHLPHLSKAEIRKIFGSMTVALSYELGTPERDGINRAYFETQRLLNIAALLGLVPALVSALLMQNVKLSKVEGEVPLQAVIEESDEEGVPSTRR